MESGDRSSPSISFEASLSPSSSEQRLRKTKKSPRKLQIFLLLSSSSRLRTLSPILRSALRTAVHTCGIQSPANNVITHTWQVFYTTSTHQHNAVLLQVVTFARDVDIYFFAVCQAHTSHLAHSRIWLLRGSCVHTHTHTSTLWAGFERRALTFLFESSTAFSNQLLNCRHFLLYSYLTINTNSQFYTRQHTPAPTDAQKRILSAGKGSDISQTNKYPHPKDSPIEVYPHGYSQAENLCNRK
ncbi:hypothetical protein PORCRE_712 [Porphyromonas crevioricanis JCM 15906]|uniref:Uncharacterized protein n=1 Tax=Porphyromonas crevioricanis JCM 15906 TaxID=1305617 RepID=T1DQZ2_9PORP|nr:hypothetical protein PORCRE_712 [Porphyromonas crevioricanis JCM 15906]